MEEINALIFFTLLDNLEFLADKRYLSKQPLKSTVLKAALVTFNFMFFLRISLLKTTFLRFGKNLRFVLFFAWLTL